VSGKTGKPEITQLWAEANDQNPEREKPKKQKHKNVSKTTCFMFHVHEMLQNVCF
jgi:hypothetical protein